MKKEEWQSVGLLIGTVIGAGILGIPYVVSKVGFVLGFIEIIVIGMLLMFLGLMIGEVSLRTKDTHELTGYAEKYLGKYGKYLLTITLTIGIYGALTAYSIGVGNAIQAIFGGTALTYSIWFFVIMSVFIYIGLKFIENFDIIFGIILATILVILALIAMPKVSLVNLAGFNIKNIFLPYGVIFFAFLGATAIPEMREALVKDKRKLKKTIIIGYLIAIAVYSLFALFIVGITGEKTSEIATIGLGEFVGKIVVVIGNLFAIAVMASSFLGLGLALRWVYQYDYKFSKNYSTFLTLLIPLILVIVNITTFIQILGFIGAVVGGLEGIVLIAIFYKAKKLGERKPEYNLNINKLLAGLLILLFIFGIIHQLVKGL